MVDFQWATRIFKVEDTNSGVHFVVFVHKAIFHGKTAGFPVSFMVIRKIIFLVSRIMTSVLFTVHGF